MPVSVDVWDAENSGGFVVCIIAREIYKEKRNRMNHNILPIRMNILLALIVCSEAAWRLTTCYPHNPLRVAEPACVIAALLRDCCSSFGCCTFCRTIQRTFNPAQNSTADMRVNLRRPAAAMPQQFLNVPEIRPCLQEMRRKGVP